MDPTALPRYILAHDESLFNIIFYLQDLSDEIAKEAFNFLNIITTNPLIYKQIMFSGKDNKEINWESQLDEKNIYKLIYSLQIIESFLEEIEISSEGVDSFSNEESILGKSCSLEEMKSIKIDWMKNFISQNGFSYLNKILEKILVEHSKNLKNKEESILMNNICLDLLLRIVRIFYSSSLNKFEIYLNITKQISEKEAREEKTDLKNFFSGELGDKIINTLNYKTNTVNLLNLLSSLIEISNRSREENSILENSFGFLINILGFAPDTEEMEKIVLQNIDVFEKISIYALLNNEFSTRQLFLNSLIILSKVCQFNLQFNFLAYMFSFTFNAISNMQKEQEANSSELFSFLSTIFEIYLANTKEFEEGKLNINDFFS